MITTSRAKMEHITGPNDTETMESKRNITYDGIEHFLGMIQSGKVENVAKRPALSTMIAILGRTAVYSGQEVTWRGPYGVHG